MPWGLHVGPRAGPEGTVSTGASREDAVLPTLLHFGPAVAVTGASTWVTLCASVSPRAPVSQCPPLCAPVSSRTTTSPRCLSCAAVPQCPSVPPCLSAPGVEEPLPMDRSRARGSLPQDTPGGGGEWEGSGGRRAVTGTPAGGRPGQEGEEEEEEEGGRRRRAVVLPYPPAPCREGGGRAAAGGGSGSPRREAGKAAVGADGRSDGRSAAPGAQRPARAAPSPAGELQAAGGGGRCSEPGLIRVLGMGSGDRDRTGHGRNRAAGL